MNIKEVDYSFITSLDFYLRTVRNCNNISTCKYSRNFKKIILSCVAHGWLTKDPFLNYEAKLEDVEKEFLLEEEIHVLATKELSKPCMESLPLNKKCFRFLLNGSNLAENK